jgi:hypothetical protein
MNKDGVAINFIIMAAIGLLVLVIIFFIASGRLQIFGQQVSQCPGQCLPHGSNLLDDTGSVNGTPQYSCKSGWVEYKGDHTGCPAKTNLCCQNILGGNTS